jgi:cytochrome c biogenesis protein CcdA
MWLSFLAVMLPREIAPTLFAQQLTTLCGAFCLGLAHGIAWLFCSAVIFTAVFGMGLTPHQGGRCCRDCRSREALSCD